MPTVEDQLELVRSKTLATLVQERIVRMVREGELISGDKLVETTFTAKLNVNRAAVREAFRGLEEAGLVKLEKNRGVFVRDFLPREAIELYEMRACLEEMGARRLAGTITDAQLAELKDINGRLLICARNKDIESYYPLNIEFHDRMIEMTEHNVLQETYRRLVDRMHLLRRRGYETGDGLIESNDEHDAVLEALAERDVERTAAAARVHVMKGMQRYVAVLRD
ncbi:FCD domain-containing protein (plasmid) [Azospirillum argentinense]|uniref:FCD domain-containing protein n=1 Tax=Azospirillum argentinense TaxID=2970906 RepID=A0A4D8PRX1_9PROT|nr:FCD domain-containing protein [Azospirillum argentinense]QCO00071.1 FCD domain-containing protein [Azospirillum argentinense]